jgi:ATP-dependent RNA helicase RhlE
LERLFHQEKMGRTLIFTRTKHGADKLVKSLQRSGVEAGAIHGNKTQRARTHALESFKTGRTPVLVATDIASRGIDVDEITHVINFDMPNPPETYVHRIGRTARAGSSGTAVSFCDHDELNDLRAIEQLIDMKLDVAQTEPDLVFDAPVPRRRRPRKTNQAMAQNRSFDTSQPRRRRKRAQRAGSPTAS